MKDVTSLYLQKALKVGAQVISSEKMSELFGYGTEDLTITQSGVFTDLAPNYGLNAVLEFRNVTIDEGCSVLGNNYSSAWRGSPFFGGLGFSWPIHRDPRFMTSGHIGTPVPFFLKVNGTLTVNGHLHMDGQGGHSSTAKHHGHTGGIQSSLITNPVANGRGWIWGSDCVSLDYWLDFYNYGLAKTFFNGQTNICGSGSSCRAAWKGSGLKTKWKYSDRTTSGPINGGGTAGKYSSVSGKNACSRGSGGFLALYYEKLDYQGFLWEDSTTAITKGQQFPANINCNGGVGSMGSSGNWGGGMMVIAARNIVVGPKGSITCNPAYPTNEGVFNLRLISDQSYADADIGGGIAFLNRPPKLPAYDSTLNSPQLQYQYNGLNFVDGTGGAGICIGYEVRPEYTKPNR